MLNKVLAFIAALIVAFFVASEVADRGTGGSTLTGKISDVRAGEWIVVSSEQTGPPGLRILLAENTQYEGDSAAMKAGAQVTVWYRGPGNGRATADRVRVLAAAR
jgi:hypothetical protein